MKVIIITSLATLLSQVQCKPCGGFSTLLGMSALMNSQRPPASPPANAASRPVIPILNVRIPKGYKVEVTSGNVLTNASGSAVPISSASQPKKGFIRRTASKVFRKISSLLGDGVKKAFKTVWSSVENRFKNEDKPITPSETKINPPTTPITRQGTTQIRKTSTPVSPIPNTNNTNTGTTTTSQPTTETRRTSIPNPPMPSTDSTSTRTSTTSTTPLPPRPQSPDQTETRTTVTSPIDLLNTSSDAFPELPNNFSRSSTWTIRFAPNSPRFEPPPSLDARSSTRPLNPDINTDNDGFRSIRFFPPSNGDDAITYKFYRYPGLLRDRTFLDRYRFPDTEGDVQDLLNRFLRSHPEFVPSIPQREPASRYIFRVRGPNNEILEERPMTQQEIRDYNDRGLRPQPSLLRGPTI